MSEPIETPAPAPEPAKKSLVRRLMPFVITGVVALLLGAAIGGAGAKPTEAPAAEPKVVTDTVEVKVADPLCKEVAAELFDMLETMNNDVLMPLSQGSAESIDAFLASDFAGIEAATTKVEGANAALVGLTDRTDALSPDYIACQTG